MPVTGLEALPPAERARVIYSHARAELSDRLWQAAIGRVESNGFNQPSPCRHGGEMDLMALVAPSVPSPPGAGPAMSAVSAPSPAPLPTVFAPDRIALPATVDLDGPGRGIAGPAALGANAAHAATLQRAAERSGLPPAALAAIVDAEAAKRPDGSWNLMSRNPRSSAAGLGQFLSGTWIGMAEQPGNWLHDLAQQKRWLGSDNRVLPAARGPLLALRYNAEASIHSIADYAQSNIRQIRNAGIRTAESPQSMAQLAYLGHHLGPGDAIRYLKGGLSENRAAHLLRAQIGHDQASHRINRAGDATTAHRNWLNGFVTRNVRPDRFSGIGQMDGA
ncbi:hypothetical protein GCM10010833_32190 [Blastomonas aquatica]|uniref:Peptidoglycan-binding protein n=2 Tax=Blastomonas aquatica TaxID=1510276 RepID=A0ABQ1JUG7_9SPHN|nr:hypothetical protein GCM10010833_32190 [Blastomonas aquatica]